MSMMSMPEVSHVSFTFLASFFVFNRPQAARNIVLLSFAALPCVLLFRFIDRSLRRRRAVEGKEDERPIWWLPPPSLRLSSSLSLSLLLLQCFSLSRAFVFVPVIRKWLRFAWGRGDGRASLRCAHHRCLPALIWMTNDSIHTNGRGRRIGG